MKYRCKCAFSIETDDEGHRYYVRAGSIWRDIGFNNEDDMAMLEHAEQEYGEIDLFLIKDNNNGDCLCLPDWYLKYFEVKEED